MRATSVGARRSRAGARPATATTGVIRKSLTGMKTSSSVADDPNLGGVRVEADLLAGLAQRGRGRVGVAGLGLAAGEG